MNKLIYIILFLGAGFIVSCSKDIETNNVSQPQTMIEGQLQPFFGAEELFLDSVYTTPEGYPVKIREVKFFLTQLSNGNQILVPSAKLDWRSKGKQIFKVAGNPELFNSLTGYVGVVQEWNHLNPIDFNVNDPLYITNANDMHWSWSPGYIFIKLEGSYDTIPGSSNFPFTFAFHLGMDQNLQQIQWDSYPMVEINKYLHRLVVKFDAARFFDGPGGTIDLKTENVSHSHEHEQELTSKASVNFAYALQFD
jgi:hypothetical protein